MSLVGGARPDLEAVMTGEIQVVRVEGGRAAQGVIEHRHLTVIDHHRVADALKVSEGVLVTSQPMFELFTQGELDIHPAAVAQDHHEEADPAAGRAYGHQSGKAPIDLGAFSGSKLEGQAGGLGFGAHLVHEAFEDAVAAGIAPGLQLLEQLLGAVGMKVEQTEQFAAPRVQFAGTGRGSARLELFAMEPASDGTPAQFEFTGDLSGRESALPQQTNLRKLSVGDHTAPPVIWRNSSPTERT